MYSAFSWPRLHVLADRSHRWAARFIELPFGIGHIGGAPCRHATVDSRLMVDVDELLEMSGTAAARGRRRHELVIKVHAQSGRADRAQRGASRGALVPALRGERVELLARENRRPMATVESRGRRRRRSDGGALDARRQLGQRLVRDTVHRQLVRACQWGLVSQTFH